MKKRLAIIIPACTDLNRGDQALVWEAAALLRETGRVDEVCLVDGGEGLEERELQSRQTKAEGYRLIRSILRHPRRGKHEKGGKVRDGRVELLRMIARSLFDLLHGTLVLALAPYPRLLRRLLDDEQLRAVETFREASVLVVKGGGFLHAFGSFSDAYYIWFQLFYLRLALRLKKPVLVLPNSFGPFAGRPARRQIRKVLRRCSFVAARESVSARALAEVTGSDVPVFPDMGYYLKAAERARGEELCHRFGVPLGEKPCVAVTVRPYRFPTSADPRAAFERYLDAVAALVREVSARGFHPVFVTHVAGPSAHENDRLAIVEVIGRVRDVSHSWIDFDGDCRDISAVYGCMDYLVGTRFHSVIFAQNAGVPCLAVGYGGNKSAGIMGDMGLEEFVIRIEEVTGEELCARFQQLVRVEGEVRTRVELWRRGATESRRRMIEQIAPLLPAAEGVSL